MNRKRNKSKQLKLLKYIPTLLICIFLLPTNYSGKSLRVNLTSCDPELPNTKCAISTVKSHTEIHDSVTNNPSNDEIPDNPTVNGIFLITSILILIISTMLTILILGYFYGVPIVKQSLVLYLYQDIAKLALLLNGSASMAILTCYFYGNGITIPPTPAKIVTYCLINSGLYLLLACNAQGCLHLYSMKEMVLDPTLPGLEDDRVAIKMMRIIGLVFVTFVTSLLFAYEGYPKIYFSMVGNNKPITELPIGTFAFTMLLGVLIATYIITSLVAVFYERRSILGHNRLITRGLRLLPCAFVFFTGFVLTFTQIFNFLGVGEVWIILLIFQIIFGGFSQVVIILISTHLKGYVNEIFQAFRLFVSDFYEKQFSRRSTQVYPMVER